MKSICFCLTLALIVLSTGCLAQTSEKRILRNQVRAPLVALKTMPYQDLAVDLTRAVDENLADVYATPIVVDLVSTDLPTGSDKASVKIKLSAPAPNTIVAIIRCDNAKGRSLAEPQVQAIIFRPGDPLVSSVDCKVKRALAGDSVRFTQVHVPDGGKPGARKAVATFTSASAIDGMPKASARLPFAFRPLGDLVYQLDPASVKISDENAKGQWSTALSHGRTQPANNETGYYGTVAMGAVKRTDKTINLQTGRNATPIEGKSGKQYPYISSVLSAHKHPETFFKYGAIEWEVRMPSRRGTWPALWLLPKSGWPPEIDVYEGFTFSSDWTPRASLSSAIHGGRKNKRSFKRWFMRLQMGDIGLTPDITSEFHKYQAIVSPKWITIFVDGIETVQFHNSFTGETWYPLMTNAVTAKPDDSYDQGTADMEIRNLKIWKLE